MRKRGAGIAFIGISAFLITGKYVSAAIFGSGVVSWNSQLFNNMLSYVGGTLSNFSIFTFIIGVTYIIWAEYEEYQSRKSSENKLD
ncbi:hypothetical protein [Oceanobacillus salinisoli]|uniref:hypothetical protein n=1 Tax=Oceanobacillus salinisoli TaxID=2678611 RepID=UPI0012E16E7E|nr:hypothetical protein [Oceanobacillus salinisoli]